MSSIDTLFSSLIQQVQALETAINSSSSTQSSAYGTFLDDLNSALAAGQSVSSADSADTSGSTGKSERATLAPPSTSPSTDGAAPVPSSTQTPSTSIATNRASGIGGDQTASGSGPGSPDKLPPGWISAAEAANAPPPGWVLPDTAASGVFTGSLAFPNEAIVPTDPPGGPYSWAGSAYNPANRAAAHGASQLVNGVQIIPFAPGWNPNATVLQSIYTEIQGSIATINTLNKIS